MAKINRTGVDAAHESIVSLASLGLIFCMVVTLVGIKIWWFKHRLTFDQSSSSNGAAGGNQPRVVARNRSSKDKRLSQQFREPVVGHGVFRKRQEDELDIERPKLLPPVRLRKQSEVTSTLFQPPSARLEEIDNDILEIPPPPSHDPPLPPKQQIELLPTTSAELKSELLEQNTELDILEDEKLQDKLLSKENLESKIEVAVHQLNKELKPVEKIPTPLKRNNSYSSKDITGDVAERRFIKAKTNFEKAGPHLAERRATGYHRADDKEWHNMEDGMDEFNHTDEKVKVIRESRWNDFEKNYNYVDVTEHDKPHEKSFNTNSVQFQIKAEEREDGKYMPTILNQRAPTGYVSYTNQHSTDLEEDKEYENEKLWQEMEQEIDGDFLTSFEDEFNKIRHSYEESDKAFLKKTNATRDKGFGKNIEEDWENFENLEKRPETEIPSITNREPACFIREMPLHIDKDETEESKIYRHNQKVQFNLNECIEDKEKGNEATFIKQRRPTGYVRDVDVNEISAQILIADTKDANNSNSTSQKVSFQLDSEDEDIENQLEIDSVLKQRRPTGFVRRTNRLDIEDEDELNEVPNETFTKPKPRQKVSFQFSTEPNSQTHEPEDEEEFIFNEMPKPLQRITKTRYIENETSRTENTATLLFSTQVSAEYAAVAENNINDSWSAIRQHRNLTEEFQQIMLEDDTKPTVSTRPFPKAAYRNPLAHSIASQLADEKEEENSTIKPRTMRDMKKSHARQMQLQDEGESGESQFLENGNMTQA